MSSNNLFPEPYRIDEFLEDVKGKTNIKVGPATFKSPINDLARAKSIKGSSFINELEKEVNRLIKVKGDWTWLKDEVTGKALKASEAISMGKR